jgi:hypothetical protein
MDGLHASSLCSTKLFSTDSQAAYTNAKSVHGHIPSCLFNLPYITVLHLSGNNLYGSLPALSNISDSLLSLILANNELVGNVPPIFWSHPFYYLDLSFNRFNGLLDASHIPRHFHRQYQNISARIKASVTRNEAKDTIVDTSTVLLQLNGSATFNVSLQVNRFSGVIPSQYSHASVINILDGNMFFCNALRSDLPVHDPQVATYQCGSDYTNYSFYAWSVTLAFILITAMIIRYTQRGISKGSILLIEYYQQLALPAELFSQSSNTSSTVDLKEEDNSTYQKIHRVIAFIDKYSLSWLKNTLYMIAFITLIILPVFIGLSATFYTVQNQFIWSASSAFLTGEIPAFVILTILMILVVLVYFLWAKYENDVFHPMLVLLKKSCSRSSSSVIALKIMLVIINFAITLTVNGLYVYSVNRGYNTIISFCISLSLSLFKILYNSLTLLGPGRRLLEDYFGLDFEDTALILLSLLNNVVVPYFAEAFVSPDCAYYAIYQAPAIQSYFFDFACFSQTSCLGTFCETSLFCPYGLEVLFGVPTYLNIYPPFHYNYQCSSSLLTSFAYVFVYRYLITGLVGPIIFLLAKGIQYYSLDQLAYCNDQKKMDNLKQRFLDASSLCPTWLQVIRKQDILLSHKTNNYIFTEKQLEMMEISLEQLERKCELIYQNRQSILVSLITDYTVLLCFGVMFPPLAIIVTISILKDLIIWRLSLLRLVKWFQTEEDVEVKSRLLNILSNVDSSLKGMYKVMSWGMWMSILVSCTFWSFCLFDTLGDQLGALDHLSDDSLSLYYHEYQDGNYLFHSDQKR